MILSDTPKCHNTLLCISSDNYSDIWLFYVPITLQFYISNTVYFIQKVLDSKVSVKDEASGDSSTYMKMLTTSLKVLGRELLIETND